MPYSCTLGGCGACKVKLTSGSTWADEAGCLSAGAACTCSAKARRAQDRGAAGVLIARDGPGFLFLSTAPADAAVTVPVLGLTQATADALHPDTMLAFALNTMVIKPGVPARTVPEFIAHAKANPGKINYGTFGPGSLNHIMMEQLARQAGMRLTAIQYKGSAPALTDMLGGQVQLALLPPGLAMTQVKAGKLRAIGTTSTGRSALVPEAASLAEVGVKDYQLEIWNAVAAPASMPSAQVHKLSALISSIVRSPEMRQRLFQQGWQVVGSSPEGLKNRIDADTKALGEIIRQQKIELN